MNSSECPHSKRLIEIRYAKRGVVLATDDRTREAPVVREDRTDSSWALYIAAVTVADRHVGVGHATSLLQINRHIGGVVLRLVRDGDDIAHRSRNPARDRDAVGANRAVHHATMLVECVGLAQV